MRRWILPAAIVAAFVLGTACPALAKGADQATISGPGLTHPIVLTGQPDAPGDLGSLSEGSGLFLAMFGPDPGGPEMVAAQPAGALGPKYEIAYRVPGGPTPDIVRQDLYPAAAGGPLTYTPAGQTAFGGGTLVQSGWYRTPESFARQLVQLGLPVSASAAPAPRASAVPRAEVRPDHHGSTSALLIGGAVVVVLAAAAALVRRRRRA
jgi:hypothetical protein